MSDFGPALTDDQWNRIRQIVHDEALRARVAASFLPLYGPLPGDATTVPKDSLSYPAAASGAVPGQRIEVNDFDTIRLATVAVNVFIKNHMLADPELAAAATMFTRAAKIVARVEDAIVFRGQDPTASPPIPGTGADALPQVFTVTPEAATYEGLAKPDSNIVTIEPPSGTTMPSSLIPPPDWLGPAVFSAVVDAINKLEKGAYYKPYACVLSDALFRAIYTPIAGSMILPADSIPPMLSGPLLRSSTLEDGTGLVISLQGNPVEIVVASDIHVRYLQATEKGEHVFRVSQRFALRVKDRTAIALIQKPSTGGGPTIATPGNG